MVDAQAVEESRSNLAISGELARAVLYNNASDARRALGLGGASILTPVGSILPYGGSEASTPAGWLFCGGQAVSRSTYAALFAVIGTTYGSGDGVTTFNVPDLRGRVLAGKDNMGGTAANRLTSGVSGVTGTTLGAAGGDERLQGHTHTFSGTTGNDSPDHSHTFAVYGGSFGDGAGAASWYTGFPVREYRASGGANSRHQHGYSGTTANHNQSQGSSANVQPTIVANYIIKALADTVTGNVGSVLTGAAGGDLSGSYPNPTVPKFQISATQPSGASAGWLWFDSNNSVLNIYTGSTWRPITVTGAAVGSGSYTGTPIQIARKTWTNETTMSSGFGVWVDATNGSYSFTPKYAGSQLEVVAELAMAPYASGNNYTGMVARIVRDSTVLTTQNQGHQVYVSVGPSAPADLYSRTVMSWVGAASNTSATTFKIQIGGYGATLARLNQNANWESHITITEWAV